MTHRAPGFGRGPRGFSMVRIINTSPAKIRTEAGVLEAWDYADVNESSLVGVHWKAFCTMDRYERMVGRWPEYKLRAVCRQQGVDDSGGADEMRRRLLERVGIEPDTADESEPDDYNEWPWQKLWSAATELDRRIDATYESRSAADLIAFLREHGR